MKNQNLNEESAKGWRGTVRAMKLRHPEIDNPWALSHWMKKKGHKPHYKNQRSSLKGTPKKKAKYRNEDKKSFKEWLQEIELNEGYEQSI